MDYTMNLVREKLAPAYRANQIWVDGYKIVATWSPLEASAINVPKIVGVDSDADFLIKSVTFTAFSTPGTFVPSPDYEVTMLDTGSGRQFQNSPVHILSFAGTAQMPYVWPEPKLIAAASSLNLQLTNLTSQAARVQIVFHGSKLFYFTGFNRSQLGLVGFGA